MNLHDAVAKMDDATVIRVLSHLTLEVQKKLPPTQSSVRSLDEAKQALAALIATDADPNLLVTEESAEAVGRKLLNLVSEESEIQDRARDLIAEPPEENQRSLAVATAVAVVMGALISWLQTKVEIEVTRKGSKTSFRFQMCKEASNSKLISDVVSTVRKILVD
jgi:hypothetical protein